MPRDVKERIMEAATIGCILGFIIGLAAFILAFVNSSVANVLAIFAGMFIISGCVLIGTNLIIKAIEETSEKGKKSKSDF